MKKYLYEYIIAKLSDEEVFFRQCEALEGSIPKWIKKETLRDVDGSIIQLYLLEKNEVRVDNDTEIGIVAVYSDINLLPYFESGE